MGKDSIFLILYYIVPFSGLEVPTSNSYSYSNSYGQVNNMINSVQSMIGDTLSLRLSGIME